MPELILPTTRLNAAFPGCCDDWGPGLHEDGFGLDFEDDVDSSDGFAAWVHERVRLTHTAGAPCPNEKHGSPRWIVEDGQMLGDIALRHYLDDRIEATAKLAGPIEDLAAQLAAVQDTARAIESGALARIETAEQAAVAAAQRAQTAEDERDRAQRAARQAESDAAGAKEAARVADR